MKTEKRMTFSEFIHLGSEYSTIEDSKIKNIFYSLFGLQQINPKIRSGHIVNQVINFDLPLNATILDAGFGQGLSLFYLARRFQHYSFIGYEVDENSIEVAKLLKESSHLDNAIINKKSLETIEDVSRFDLIYSSDVLEHIDQDELVLNKFHTALKIGGKLLLHLPLQYERCKRIFPWFRFFDTPDHVRDEYLPREIEQKLENAGFKEIKIKYSYTLWKGEIAFELNNFIFSNRFLLILSQILTMPFTLPLGFLEISELYARGNSMVIEATKID